MVVAQGAGDPGTLLPTICSTTGALYNKHLWKCARLICRRSSAKRALAAVCRAFTKPQLQEELSETSIGSSV